MPRSAYIATVTLSVDNLHDWGERRAVPFGTEVYIADTGSGADFVVFTIADGDEQFALRRGDFERVFRPKDA